MYTTARRRLDEGLARYIEWDDINDEAVDGGICCTIGAVDFEISW